MDISKLTGKNGATKVQYQSASSAGHLDIAIIGIAMMLPEADTLNEFWDNLINMKNSIRTLPEERGVLLDAYHKALREQTPETKKLGYINGVETFDHEYFGITPREADLMDPNQRVFLQTAFKAVEDAGYLNGKLVHSNTGVYVGYGDNNDYLGMIDRIDPNAKELAIAGNLKAIISSRISYLLDLKGFALNIDTACSSSLVALHMACTALRNGDCTMALVGGVKMNLNPVRDNLQIGIESPDDTVRAFSEDANGTVWGEGSVALVIKPLDRAVRDRDHVYAVIKGSAANQDGNSIGITAPNRKAQESVLLAAWKDAGIHPSSISYVESHGTGTNVGDPIEIEALNNAFARFTNKVGFCSIGTLKANIGHLAECSGLASVVKAVLCIQNKQLPPSINISKAHPSIDTIRGAASINTQLCSWEGEEPRTCGISSFGFSGTNCHVVLQEYCRSVTRQDDGDVLLTISAKTSEAVWDYVAAYTSYLSQSPCSIQDICYSANTGKDHHPHRLAVIGHSKEDVLNKLSDIAKARNCTSNDGVFISQSLNTIDPTGDLSPQNLQPLYSMALDYVQGRAVDWGRIYDGQPVYRVSTPTYPFQKIVHWIVLPESAQDAAASTDGITLCGREDGLYTSTERNLAKIVCDVLGYREFGIEDNLSSKGGDSITLLKIKNLIDEVYPGAVKISDIMSLPTIQGLAEYIDAKNIPSRLRRTGHPVCEDLPENQDIAVIGIALRFPDADTPVDFWNNIQNQKICIGQFPDERAIQARRYLHQTGSPLAEENFETGAYLNDIDCFDYAYFNISPKDAALMDPNQRLFLQVSQQALEDAGYQKENLKAQNVGVFCGFAGNLLFNYGKMAFDTELESFNLAVATNLPAIIPSRVSYHLDLKGPSLLTDTACSSSLVSMHLACQSLKNGECDMALAGGVRLDLVPLDSEYKKLGVESPSGRVRPFDNDADGTLWGEGVAAVLLKPLAKAVADRDNIYSVVKGSAINQDGTSMGITAPNSMAQTEVIEKAWKAANIDPADISYIEAHGTATNIGDPIEIEGLQRAFDKYTRKRQFAALSSLKANVGHLETASGIASVVKAVLALRSKTIPGIAELNWPNERIDFVDTAMYLCDEPRYWEADTGPRTCCVSSFGFSGTNCHVVLQEYDRDQEYQMETEGASPQIFAVSGRDDISLKAVIQDYICLFRSVHCPKHLEDICYTANIHREHHKVRFACMCDTIQELEKKLQAFLDGSALPGMYTQEDASPQDSEFGQICTDYCAGGNRLLDVYRSTNCNKVTVPYIRFLQTKAWLAYGDEGSGALTLNGKDSAYTDTETAVGEIWRNVIGLNQVDVTQGFYEMGGHSISMMKIISEIKARLNIEVGINEFTINDTVLKLSAFVDSCEEKAEGTVYPICVHNKADFYEPFPLTQIQMSYLIGRDEAFAMGGVCTHVYVEVETPLDIDRLECSMNMVIRRHPMLRAVIEKEGVQRFLREVPRFAIERIDAVGLPDDEKERLIDRERAKSSHLVFEPGEWPFIEMKAIRTDDNTHYLFIGIDMLIADGTSLMLIGNDLMQYYEEPLAELPALSITMRDYMLAYNQFMESNTYERDKAFWLGKLDELPDAPSLPMMQDPLQVRKPTFNRLTRSIPEEEWAALKRLAQSLRVSTSSLLCNLYAEVLAYWSNMPRFTINFTVFNRYPFHEQVNDLIGDFTSVMLIDVDMKKNETFEERASEIQVTINTALEHRHYDGVELIREISQNRNMRAQPVMPIVFTSMLFNNNSDAWSKLGNIKMGLSQTPQVYLDFQAIESDGRLTLNWDYVEEIFDTSVITGIFEQYIQLAQYVISMEVNLVKRVTYTCGS